MVKVKLDNEQVLILRNTISTIMKIVRDAEKKNDNEENLLEN